MVSWGRVIGCSILIVSMTACGGGGAMPPPGPDNEAIFNYSSGGTLSITDPASPIVGTRVVIQPETLDASSETIRIDYETNLPGNLPQEALDQGAEQASATLILHRTGTNDLSLPAEVTLPYDEAMIGENEIPLVFYWDEDTGKYSSVALTALDRSTGKLTFKTAHFSSYVTIVLRRLQAWGSPPEADTGFRPLADDFFIRNFGAYDSPGGSCLGMANYASWYFDNKKSVKGAGLQALYREGVPSAEEDDQNVRELISRAYIASSQYWAFKAMESQTNLGDAFTGAYLIQTMLATGSPQTLLMADRYPKTGYAHAATVYGYDAVNKRFKIYDNNEPRTTFYLPWTPEDGFGAYSRTSAAKVFAFDALHSSFSPATMASLFEGVENGWSNSKYATIEMVSPEPSQSDDDLLIAEGDSQVQLSGNVPRLPGEENPNAQRYAHIYLNGVEKAGVATVDGNGEFDYTLATLPDPDGTDLMIIVSEDAQRWRRGLRAFLQATIRVRDDSIRSLALTLAGEGTGRITENAYNVSCAANCTELFAEGTTLTLTAMPDAGQTFSGWSGACTGTALNCNLTMSQDRAVTATFGVAQQAGWSDEMTVSAGGAGQPQVAIRRNGEALMVWRQLDSGSSAIESIWASNYSPGIGWSTPERLEDNLQGTRDLNLSMDPASGKAMAVWQQLPDDLSSNEGYNVWANAFDPATGWGDAEAIDNTNATAGSVTVGVDAGGNTVAVWSQLEAPFSGKISIYANRHTASGGWGIAQLIENETELGRQDTLPTLYVAPGGEAVAVWVASGGSTASRGFWTNRLTGSSWSTATQIVSRSEIGAFSISAPVITGNASGQALLGFGRLDVTGGLILNKPQVKRYQGGWSSGNTQVVPDFENGSVVVTVFPALGDSGQSLALWGDTNGTRLMASLGTSGSSWADAIAISNSTRSIQSLPSYGLDDQGNALVTWEQGNSVGEQTSSEIWVAKYDTASGWSASTIMDSSNELPSDPEIAVNAKGNAVLAWQGYESNVGSVIVVRHYASGR